MHAADPVALVAHDMVGRMNAALTHRGPDAAGQHVEPGVALAMRRLSIIDLEGGDQPIANETGDVHVVQNGEIYNYRELREHLSARGHAFTTASDTEVLVHLYEEYGTEFAEHLRGMFAIAVWDAPRRRLVLARDPFGIKPLFYAESGGDLAFSSELRSLLAWDGLDFEIDQESLAAYLAFNWIPAPRSILAGARKLTPGHVLVREDGRTTVSRYARPGAVPEADLEQLTMDEAAERLRETMRDSVRAHLVADVPVGVLLSGGVDSSFIAALAAEEVSGPLKTFSIGFREEAFNELDKARYVAERYGTDHEALVVEPDAATLLPKVARAYDEPLGDSSALPTFIVSELAASKVKVALAGEGGDELFGGYFTYIGHDLGPVVRRGAAAAWPLMRRLPSGRGPALYTKFEGKAKRFSRGASLDPLERHTAWQEVLPADVRREMQRADFDVLATHRARFAESAGAENVARYQDLDLGTYLVDDLLMKSDRASMANSLEMRVPFVDREVAALAFSLPTSLKLRRFQTKRVLRAASEPFLGPEVLDAPKQGFSIPAAAWLRGELKGFAEDVLFDGPLADAGIADPAPVRKLMDDHLAGRTDNSRQLWGLLMLGLWTSEMR